MGSHKEKTRHGHPGEQVTTKTVMNTQFEDTFKQGEFDIWARLSSKDSISVHTTIVCFMRSSV